MILLQALTNDYKKKTIYWMECSLFQTNTNMFYSGNINIFVCILESIMNGRRMFIARKKGNVEFFSLRQKSNRKIASANESNEYGKIELNIRDF